MTHPPTTPPPPAPRSDAARVRDFLAERDVPCQSCGYNLRGLDHPACPECGATFSIILDDPLAAERSMVEWLRTNDLVCRKCRTNLRGHSSNTCPTCGRTYALQRGTRIRAHRPRYWWQRPRTDRPPASPLKILIVIVFLSPLLVVVGWGLLVIGAFVVAFFSSLLC